MGLLILDPVHSFPTSLLLVWSALLVPHLTQGSGASDSGRRWSRGTAGTGDAEENNTQEQAVRNRLFFQGL